MFLDRVPSSVLSSGLVFDPSGRVSVIDCLCVRMVLGGPENILTISLAVSLWQRKINHLIHF